MTRPKAPTPAEPKPLLDLTTLDPANRPFIRIDGKRYDLNTPADFGIGKLAILDGLQTRLAAIRKPLGRRKKLTQDQAEEIDRILRRGASLVLRDVPDAVLDALTGSQKLDVIDSFTGASNRTGPKANRAARRSTGARSSRDSAGATASTAG